ncbi:polymer-forming cytoskeletal protein [Neolewinella lacunae]|uniref:Polymer-forming cytoskeletal protein n=1 Tax=Neolewinella lacunae TaxID=1517758 RepID=A0A923PH30_9BACT|nr:polymer-forming cytoskeletal protein [Neolewinella lacunae]MBC6993998.1 polymer-forming cytoskeletal protein [Neolewinella lacunae]MDN3634668.1 polymer-forming cytoskeletal protein [Neolewinella lacunae]
MFGNNNGKDSKSTESTSSSNSGGSGGGVNTIDVNTKIKGNITAGGNIRIDGTLVGNLKCEALLVIGPKGYIEGDVECVKAIIEGKFQGNLVVKDDLTLQATSQVSGDVKATKMAVLGGAQINGTCTVPFSGTAITKATMTADNPLKNKTGATS